MQASHQEVLERYESFRMQARDIAYQSLPSHLKQALTLSGIDHKALNAFLCSIMPCHALQDLIQPDKAL